MSKKLVALKPCPFCGLDAVRSAYFTFGCSNCAIWMNDGWEDKWNNRVLAASVSEKDQPKLPAPDCIDVSTGADCYSIQALRETVLLDRGSRNITIVGIHKFGRKSDPTNQYRMSDGSIRTMTHEDAIEFQLKARDLKYGAPQLIDAIPESDPKRT